MQREVAQTPTRAECGDVWLPADRDRWKLHFDVDDELVWFCPQATSESSGTAELGRFLREAGPQRGSRVTVETIDFVGKHD